MSLCIGIPRAGNRQRAPGRWRICCTVESNSHAASRNRGTNVFEPRALVAAGIRQTVAPPTALGPAREYGVAARTEAASIFDKASNNGLRVGYELAAEPENVREASLLVARGSAIDNSAHGLRLA